MILYLGNILSKRGGSVGFIETLTPKLSQRYELRAFSDKKNKIQRLRELLGSIYKFRKQASVVLVDTFSTQAFWFAVAAAALCRFLNIPYVPVLRGGNLPARLQQWPRISTWLFSGASAMVVPSTYLQGTLKVAGFEPTYIPNFIELSNYPFRLREAIRPKLLWVRAFHTIYNPMMALDVLTILKRRFPQTEVCMVGADTDGSLAYVKEAIAERNLEASVQITGRLLKEDWIALSADYDVFINTTHIDNQPVSVIEAMALGLPVVSTDVGGIPYLLTQDGNGMLVKDGDAAAMASAVEQLLMDSALARRLSQNGRSSAEGFAWERVSAKWFDLLDSYDRSGTP